MGQLLTRLQARAERDYQRKWFPGQVPTEDEQLWNYICGLHKRIEYLNEKATELSWLKNPDRMGQ